MLFWGIGLMSIFVKESGFYKNFFSLSAAMVLQSLVTTAVSLADNVMLGNYSEPALAGVALAIQIQFILNMIVLGVGEGIVVLSSQYWGIKDINAIKKIINCAIKTAIFISALVGIFVFIFPEFSISLFTSDAAVIAEGVKYIQIICFSYVLFAITNTLLAGLRSVETVKIGFYISMSTLIINVVLNYILIYGNFGAPRLGVQGAAIATLTARIIELVVVVIYLAAFDKKLKFSISCFGRLDSVLFSDYIKVGIPVIISNAMWGIAMSVQMAILGHLGPEVITANSISATIFQIASVFSYSSSNATGVIIGRTVGENDFKKLKEYTKTLQIIFIFIGIIAGSFLFLIKEPILTLYTLSESTRAITDGFLNVLVITIIGTSYQVACLVGIVRGAGDTKFVLYNDAVFQWGIVIPLSLLAAYVWQLNPVMVFFFLKSDQLLKCIVAVIKVNKTDFAKKLTREHAK